ncbi:hypothetical protein BJY01DRAFT_250531 [Aspergillus pseudoustus]|uniref:Uncharacterized protein n=1 Tax=Aspergillus pseudoustus TaxID=1810923 RepID=A0ABR4JHM5_9EURO
MEDLVKGVLRFGRRFDSERVADWSEHQHLHRRQIIRDALTEIFDKLYYSPSPCISLSTAKDLQIVVKQLKLVETGNYDSVRQDFQPEFFKPMPMGALEFLKVDFKEKSVQGHLSSLDSTWSHAETGNCGGYNQAKAVAETLSRWFRKLERVPVGENGASVQDSLTLQEWSGWIHRRPSPKIEGTKYMRPSGADGPEGTSPTPWNAQYSDGWLRDDSNPHQTVMVVHTSPPHDDLLRAEVLTIIGLMRERLATQTLIEHKIIPVRAILPFLNYIYHGATRTIFLTVVQIQVISCMADFQARVLQAHFQYGRLTIFKSLLWSFKTVEDREENLLAFLLYLGAKPVGDTIL